MPRAADDELFLPDFCGIRAVFMVVLIGELLAFVVTLADGAAAGRRLETLALSSLLIQWVALSAAAVLCAARRSMRGLPEPWVVAGAYGAILLVTWIVSEAAFWVVARAGAPGVVIELGRGEFLLRNVALAAIVGAVALRYFYVQHHWRRQVRAESEARVQALQARIRPHFFFNCMNTIAGLTRTRPAAAENAIEDLADLFRASVNGAQDLVTLETELELCRKYLSVERLRLGERLAVEWDTGDLPGDLRLPALTLQPLIENAVYHGIEPRPEGGTIRVHGERRGDRMAIVIDNPVPAGGPARTGGNRIAQDNVRQRLAAHFAGAGELAVEALEGLYRVTVLVPYAGR